jgi:serine/threonine protein kinase
MRHIGSGGMADVYLARDRRLGREVAVKVLRAGSATSATAERFLREIETVARLQHPNIVGVHDAGDAAGRLFFVMPFVAGESLRERLRRTRRLDWQATRSLIRDVADALMHAHERGVVHRDVKPENILIEEDRAMIADFGIARLLDRGDTALLTQAGEGLGTPVYMSPEQAFGEEGIDGRTDVYSLACVTYEMLAGTPPFAGHNAYAILMKKSREPAPSLPPDVSAGLPAGVGQAIARSLAAAPEARHATPREFAASLDGDMLPFTPTSGTATPPHRAPFLPPGTAVLVLPLANRSSDGANDALGDGIAEELIYALSRVPGIRVVARTTAFAFKGFHGDIRDVASQVNAAAVLEGSLIRSGDRLRLTVRLVDGETGFDRWSERYDRTISDILDMQDDLAGAVVEAIKGTLGERDRRFVAATTGSVEAFRLCLDARFHWNSRTETGLHKAVQLLRQATALDPGYADAHAAEAVAMATLAIYGAAAPAHAFGAARDAAERTLALRPGHSDALAARACARITVEADWPGGERDFQRAAAARSTTPTTLLWYAMHVLVPQRRFAEARVALADARRIDPLSPFVPLTSGLASLYEGDADSAIATLLGVVGTHPELGVAHFFLGQALAGGGQVGRAVSAYADARKSMGEAPELLGALAVARAAAGDGQAAEALVRRLRELAAERYVSPVVIAMGEAACGNQDGALTALESAVEVRAADLVWVDLRPIFSSLSRERRYAEVLARTGLYRRELRAGEMKSA